VKVSRRTWARRPRSLILTDVAVAATTALPYEHLERATAGLRAELRQKLLAVDVHQMPDWGTFTVTEPRELTDLRGRSWYEYRAAVETSGPFDRASSGGIQSRREALERSARP
jgi:hypothetical protein